MDGKIKDLQKHVQWIETAQGILTNVVFIMSSMNIFCFILYRM